MKSVKLSKRYTPGSASFDALAFREPTLADYRQVGKVIELQRGVVVTYPEAIWAYADRLLESSVVPPGAMGELDLEDAMAVEEAIVGFFTEARSRLNARTNSSSGSDGDQAT